MIRRDPQQSDPGSAIARYHLREDLRSAAFEAFERRLEQALARLEEEWAHMATPLSGRNVQRIPKPR